MIPVKRLSLTDFTAKMPRGAREKTLKKARENMNDFERFKLMVARKKRSQAVKKSLKKP